MKYRIIVELVPGEYRQEAEFKDLAEAMVAAGEMADQFRSGNFAIAGYRVKEIKPRKKRTTKK